MPIDPKAIDDLARRLAAAVPEGVRQAGRDLENNFKMVLQNALGKLDLVTREEFEVQQQVLARTRDKLESLAQRLAELESELKPPRR
jgi:BMFP domain-containing protein YqiC